MLVLGLLLGLGNGCVGLGQAHLDHGGAADRAPAACSRGPGCGIDSLRILQRPFLTALEAVGDDLVQSGGCTLNCSHAAYCSILLMLCKRGYTNCTKGKRRARNPRRADLRVWLRVALQGSLLSLARRTRGQSARPRAHAQAACQPFRPVPVAWK